MTTPPDRSATRAILREIVRNIPEASGDTASFASDRLDTGAGGDAHVVGSRESGISALAVQVMARLRAEGRAQEMSHDIQRALGSPVVTALAHALCEDDDDAELIVDDLLSAGLTLEDLCLDHLAPAARLLGDWWDNDKLPFTDVTIASARIHAIMRRISRAAPTPMARSQVRGAVFVAVPGEQHTLGVIMAADMFRRKGWDVGLLVGLTHDEVMARLTRDDRGVIGLSCSGDHSCAALGRLMTSLRRHRPDAQLVIAGQVVSDPRRIAALPAADAIVTCAVEAEAVIAGLEQAIAPRARRAGRSA